MVPIMFFNGCYDTIRVMVILLLVLAGLIDIAVLVKLVYAFRLLRMPDVDDTLIVVDDLPSVSICITARNETHAMTQCLERVVASDYPKLEVIVLDDGSRDDTSILIKSFAHAGVRFVEGRPLPDEWLGKNYAQSVLASEASGTYVFFMDVDTLIERHTVRRAVEYLMQKNIKMVSIIPIRDDNWHLSTLFATMRHFWTIMRFRPVRPRAAANAWLVDRETLVDCFAQDARLAQSMEVETTIARHLADKSSYRLVLSDKKLGLRYEKRWSSQVETSLRLLYPQCGKHWYQVVGLALLLGMTVVPYVLVWLTPWAWIVAAFQLYISYFHLSRIWARYRLVGALLLPFILVQEIMLLVYSMYKYQTGAVTWKGRPIATSEKTI